MQKGSEREKRAPVTHEELEAFREARRWEAEAAYPAGTGVPYAVTFSNGAKMCLSIPLADKGAHQAARDAMEYDNPALLPAQYLVKPDAAVSAVAEADEKPKSSRP
ncbi:MAG: hypothetical protein V4490_08245 [Pseudomonadota bacterium]